MTSTLARTLDGIRRVLGYKFATPVCSHCGKKCSPVDVSLRTFRRVQKDLHLQVESIRVDQTCKSCNEKTAIELVEYQGRLLFNTWPAEDPRPW